MKVAVNSDCQGHSRCLMYDTTIFESDDMGYVSVAGDGSVPEDQQESVRLAAANCPERAISIVD